MKASIRTEEAQDHPAISELLLCSFPGPDENKLVDLLRNNEHLVVSLVAERRGRVVGHIAFSPVGIEHPQKSAKGVGLAPVSVHPDFQRAGIGGQLILAGLEECAALGYSFCVVLGEPPYYSRFGFETASRWGLKNAYGVDEPFMVRALGNGEIPRDAGLVSYSEEFSIFI